MGRPLRERRHAAGLARSPGWGSACNTLASNLPDHPSFVDQRRPRPDRTGPRKASFGRRFGDSGSVGPDRPKRGGKRGPGRERRTAGNERNTTRHRIAHDQHGLSCHGTKEHRDRAPRAHGFPVVGPVCGTHKSLRSDAPRGSYRQGRRVSRAARFRSLAAPKRRDWLQYWRRRAASLPWMLTRSAPKMRVS